ncbi:lipopolysaccharide heptosyltransferase II [Sulfurimonas sp. SWIR-19]|uniref:lipopolysaccharide heptosyltransferase II n=1 Tax=Sulfurimonas sp. SWIR-19 TaxID=2878390 RepID=UPI001CF50FF1|nr:lipopolysaccharide heptosyltransferase II [Sulfurimonas sp. SWIR-19]UCN01057.1 lipopolysaccharide heptosyltransferase II [Sulfurimonas sp. SWIR-19]
MRILIILPNWLGDAIMATPAIELLTLKYPNAQFTFVGSYVSIEALKHHPLCERAIVDETKKAPSRFMATYKLAKELGTFHLAVSFRNQIHSTLLLRFTNTVICCARASWHSRLLLSHTPKIRTNQHLVEQYTQIAMVNVDDFTQEIPPLKLYIKPKSFEKPTLGINAGATYGSAKRWYPERFAEVATYFSKQYDIIIFGGPNEVQMAQEIEDNLKALHVNNYTNLAGKTNIKELCANIGGCSLFITNDSGPMHVAAAYGVPTVAIFGPTKYKETSQWKNEKSIIVRHELECSPCMKRECPLKHHDCMKGITASEVIEAVKKLEI